MDLFLRLQAIIAANANFSWFVLNLVVTIVCGVFFAVYGADIQALYKNITSRRKRSLAQRRMQSLRNDLQLLKLLHGDAYRVVVYVVTSALQTLIYAAAFALAGLCIHVSAALVAGEFNSHVWDVWGFFMGPIVGQTLRLYSLFRQLAVFQSTEKKLNQEIAALEAQL